MKFSLLSLGTHCYLRGLVGDSSFILDCWRSTEGGKQSQDLVAAEVVRQGVFALLNFKRNERKRTKTIPAVCAGDAN